MVYCWECQGIHYGRKKYKRAYRKLLTPLKKEFRDDFETTADSKESNTLLERKLIRSFESNEDFKQFFSLSRDLLAAIRIIIPESNRLHEALNTIKETEPSHFFMSCVCYHSAIMVFCEFVHLHRIPDKFKIGFQLARDADNHLKIGVIHYLKIIKNLVSYSKINWATKGINEISKILGKRSKPLLKMKNPKVNVIEAIKALEISMPFAKYAYGTDCCTCVLNGTETFDVTIDNRRFINNYLIPISESQFCIKKLEIKDGFFDLPLGLKGIVSWCLGNITVSFRGSANFWNYITDVLQHIVGTSVVYKMALGLLLVLKEQYTDRRFWVMGHSLGGGLTQFAVIGMNCKDFVGFGYNSAGLSKTNKELLKNRFSDNVFHLHLKKDIVFSYGFQLGFYVEQYDEVDKYLKAHELCTMCEKRKFIVAYGIRSQGCVVEKN